jgi:hypothetical protein
MSSYVPNPYSRRSEPPRAYAPIGGERQAGRGEDRRLGRLANAPRRPPTPAQLRTSRPKPTTLPATKNACATPSFANKDCLSALGSLKLHAKLSSADSNGQGCFGRYAEATPSSPFVAASSAETSRTIGKPDGRNLHFYNKSHTRRWWCEIASTLA